MWAALQAKISNNPVVMEFARKARMDIICGEIDSATIGCNELEPTSADTVHRTHTLRRSSLVKKMKGDGSAH
jgi:hypothetical protein